MEISAFSISKLLSDLIGRHVAAKVVNSVDFTPANRTACYTVQPNGGTAVVQIDFHLLGSFAGIMIGFNAAETDAQVRTGKLDENLTDAAQEVMNVLSSAVVSEGRANFKGLFVKAADYSAQAQRLTGGGHFPLLLQVTPAGGKAGFMLINSDT